MRIDRERKEVHVPRTPPCHDARPEAKPQPATSLILYRRTPSIATESVPMRRKESSMSRRAAVNAVASVCLGLTTGCFFLTLCCFPLRLR